MIEDNNSLAKLPDLEPRDNLLPLKLDFDIDGLVVKNVEIIISYERTIFYNRRFGIYRQQPGRESGF